MGRRRGDPVGKGLHDMDVLIADTLEPEVLAWLSARHAVVSDPELARHGAALRARMAQARSVIVPASVSLEAALLRQAVHLRAIGRLTPAIDRIDLAACAARGIEIVRPASAGVIAEAEFAVGALLQMLRRVPVISPDGLLVGRELSGSTIGVIGMTPTARVLVDLLRAFGALVIGYDPGLHASDALWSRWNVTPVGLRELIEQADGVCVLLNYFSRYRGLLGERYLSACRQDQVLVNLSSSLILEENALAEALGSGRMAAAWLDSVEPGTTGPGRPLHQIDSLQVTPRVASTTLQSHLRASWDVARRLDEILSEGATQRDAPLSPVPSGARTGYSGAPPPG